MSKNLSCAINYNQSTMNLVLDLIFPKKCIGCGRLGSYICDKCFSKIEIIENPICPECERQAIGGKTHPGCLRRFGLDGLIAACRYKGIVRSAIQKIKYKWSYDISNVLIDLLVQNLWRFNFPQGAVLVPIPLHINRKRWRGFNQAEILARELNNRFGQVNLDLIERILENKSQVGLSKKERKQNVKGIFALRETQGKLMINGRDFILVDDVFTSGATMSEAAGVLKRAGAKSIWGMAMALG